MHPTNATLARRASKGNLMSHPRLRVGLVFGGEKCGMGFRTANREIGGPGIADLLIGCSYYLPYRQSGDWRSGATCDRQRRIH